MLVRKPSVAFQKEAHQHIRAIVHHLKKYPRCNLLANVRFANILRDDKPLQKAWQQAIDVIQPYVRYTYREIRMAVFQLAYNKADDITAPLNIALAMHDIMIGTTSKIVETTEVKTRNGSDLLSTQPTDHLNLIFSMLSPDATIRLRHMCRRFDTLIASRVSRDPITFHKAEEAVYTRRKFPYLDQVHKQLYEKYAVYAAKYYHYSGRWQGVYEPRYIAWNELRELHVGSIQMFKDTTPIELPCLRTLTCSACHLRLFTAPALTKLTIKGWGCGVRRLARDIRNFPLLEYADINISATQVLLDALNVMAHLRYIWIQIGSLHGTGETSRTPIVLPSIPMSLMILSNEYVLLNEYVVELGENCSFDLSAATKLKRLICSQGCHVVNAPRTLQSVFCTWHDLRSKMSRHLFRFAPYGLVTDLPHTNSDQWKCNVQFEMRRDALYIGKIRCSGHCENLTNVKRVVDVGGVIRHMF